MGRMTLRMTEETTSITMDCPDLRVAKRRIAVPEQPSRYNTLPVDETGPACISSVDVL